MIKFLEVMRLSSAVSRFVIVNHRYTPFLMLKSISQVFSPEVVCRKPRDELMFLFHAVCSLLDAMADRGSTGDILSICIKIHMCLFRESISKN